LHNGQKVETLAATLLNHENTKFKKHENIRKYFVVSFFHDFVMRNLSIYIQLVS